MKSYKLYGYDRKMISFTYRKSTSRAQNTKISLKVRADGIGNLPAQGKTSNCGSLIISQRKTDSRCGQFFFLH